MKTSEIVHHPEMGLFVMKIGDDFAKIEYVVKGDIYYLTHSEVPKNLRGKGVGKELVEKTIEYLHSQQLKSVAICSYIKSIVNRSEKLKELS